MSIFVITYDLRKPGQKHAKVLAYIKKSDRWATLSESCYLVTSPKNAATIRDELKEHLDANDTLYIIEAGRDWASTGSEKVNDLVDYILG